MSFNPLDWRIAIVDAMGRPTQAFQQLFNSLINFGPSIKQDSNNQVSINVDSSTISSGQNISSTTYVDVSPAGPSVKVVTNTSALVLFGATGTNTGGTSGFCVISPAISGATTIAASDINGTSTSVPAGQQGSMFRVLVISGLTPGNNTFTLKYRVSASSYNMAQQSLTVIPL